MFAMLS